MNGIGLPQELARAFGGYRRRLRRIRVLGGLFFACAIVVGGTGVAVAADRLFRLPSSVRAVCLIALGIALLFALVRHVLQPALRRISNRRAAVRLGRRFPDMEEDLISAVEFSSDADSMPGVSLSLIRAALHKIASRARRLDIRRAVPVRPLAETAAVFLIVTAAFAGAYHVRPEAVRNGLHRLLRPDRAVPFFSYVKLTVTPGDKVVAEADTIAIACEVTGRVVERVRLDMRVGDETSRMALPCEDGRAAWTSGPLFEDIEYRLSAGDGLSDWYRVRVVPPPAVAGRSGRLRLPGYAGGEVQAIESLASHIEMVEGTALSLAVRPADRGDDPLLACEGELRFGDESLRLTDGESGLLRSSFFTPEESGPARITLRDGYGLTSRTPEEIAIQLIPDALPRVRLVAPTRDLAVLISDRVAVTAEAEDEFGLRYLDLLLRRTRRGEEEARRPWERIPMKPGDLLVRQLQGDAELSPLVLGLQPGDAIEFRAVAADFAGDRGAREGSSETRRLVVISEMEHLERNLRGLDDLRLEVLRLAAEEKMQSASADELANRSESESVAAEARAAQREEMRHAEEAERLARQAEELLQEMARNPSTPPKLLADMEQMARELRAVGQQPIRDAAGELGEASQSEQSDQADPLRQAAADAEEAAERLERVARRMESARRKALLEKLAEDAEKLAKLQRELRESVPETAAKTLGRSRQQLTPEERRELERLALGQLGVKAGADQLAKNLDKAARSLAFSNPSDAAAARSAKEKMEAEEMDERLKRLAERVGDNVLLAEMPEQESMAQNFSEIAEMLRRAAESDPIEAVSRMLDEFIKRQTALNADMEQALAEEEVARSGKEMGSDQARLGSDVSENADALHFLSKELGMPPSETASKLDAASEEMGSGAEELGRPDVANGLERGREALALLKEAQKQFQQEGQQMKQASQGRIPFEAMLLLQRMLTEQKAIHRQTGDADAMPPEQADAFDRLTRALANRQSGLGMDAKRLGSLLQGMQGGPEMAQMIGDQMEQSRAGLGQGNAGRQTRVAQQQAITLMEQMMGMCRSACKGQGMGGMRMMALMQMMSRAGGGFTGGTNAPVLPRNAETAEEEWTKWRSRFEERLAAGAESEWPPQYRQILAEYFDTLRSIEARETE